MPNYIRFYTGKVYFFTLVAFERRNIFCEKDFLLALRQSLNEVRKICPFEIMAWTQLPDHFHCILQFQELGVEFGQFWGAIKRKTTQSCPKYHLNNNNLSFSKLSRNEKGVFQRRFYEHLIRNEQDLQQHIDYIHYNPVKHGYVNSVKDWQYSTFHRYVKNGFYDENWGENIDLADIDEWD